MNLCVAVCVCMCVCVCRYNKMYSIRVKWRAILRLVLVCQKMKQMHKQLKASLSGPTYEKKETEGKCALIFKSSTMSNASVRREGDTVVIEESKNGLFR